MDSIRVSEAPDTGSIPVEATNYSRYPDRFGVEATNNKKFLIVS